MFSLVVAFTNWNLIQAAPLQFAGLDNFAALLRSQDFWLYFINTVYFMLGLPVAIAGSLFLAVLLSQKLRAAVIYRTLFYLPSFTAGVALIILWKALYNPSFGPINAFLDAMLEPIRQFAETVGGWWLIREQGATGWLGGGSEAPPWLSRLSEIGPPEWLASTKNLLGLDVEHVRMVRTQWGLGARDAIIFMGIWTAVGGGNMLLYLAGISNIPPELYEAAEIDGAGRWAKFRHITWPQLAPTTFFILIMSVPTARAVLQMTNFLPGALSAAGFALDSGNFCRYIRGRDTRTPMAHSSALFELRSRNVIQTHFLEH